jgi:hypothetical protein
MHLLEIPGRVALICFSSLWTPETKEEKVTNIENRSKVTRQGTRAKCAPLLNWSIIVLFVLKIVETRKAKARTILRLHKRWNEKWGFEPPSLAQAHQVRLVFPKYSI